MVQALGETMGERLFEGLVVEYRRNEQIGERRFERQNGARVADDGVPDRINGLQM
jgi:hypothetical protein